MEGPNLLWGDPCGTYRLDVFEGGNAALTYTQVQRNGGRLTVQIPFDLQSLAEMCAMLRILTFTTVSVEVPDGEIAVH